MSTSGLNMSRRIRRTPYTDRVETVGVRGFSVVNHMLLPKAFEKTRVALTKRLPAPGFCSRTGD